ncbi:unnamed protein product [Trifolium pratense]|uniref:Uncharacterized protein n=1 Tax=Trifolium pratense TaxID=57577 RepID=A0ACB0IK87_TRIPR|nr:unnamed protein product [Trifolium pratense]
MELSECFNLLNGIPTITNIAKMLIKKLGSMDLCMLFDDQPHTKTKELRELGVEGTLGRGNTRKVKAQLKQ